MKTSSTPSRLLNFWQHVLLLAFGLGSALPCSHALAETALILPPGGDVDEASVRTVETAVLSLLRGQGFAVSLHRDFALAQPSVRRCVDLDCASNLVPSLRPDLTVALAVWQQPDAPQHEPVVVVTLLDSRGRYPAQVQAQHDLSDAANHALLQAQALRLLGPGPWISIKGVPQGADVEIDGERVGSLPFRAPLAAGAHKLQVSAEGFVAHIDTVEIPLKATHLLEHEVKLAKTDEVGVPTASLTTESASARSTTQPSAWNYVVGGALAAGAVALAIDPIRNAAQSGECVGSKDDVRNCGERVFFGRRSIGLTVAATALLLGSGYFFAFRPIHVEVDASPQHAQARLRLQF